LESVATNAITFSVDGTGADPTEQDVAIVVIGETPYAEYEGDREDLGLDTVDQATITTVQASGVPIVLVLVSGRPMIITDEIEGVPKHLLLSCLLEKVKLVVI
jgi:beta-glucosidase